MAKKPTTQKVENLAQEAADLTTNGAKPQSDEITDLLAQFTREADAMKAEMQDVKKRFHNTMKMGGDELKAEIAHHPMQSVMTAFALGFVASLVLRR